MSLTLFKPRQALNKAYLKVKPNRTDMERFKAQLVALLDRTNDTESEEFHKNLVSDFLKKSFYDPGHFINTKGRNDLVIHTGPTAHTPVGVLIEAKKPTNKAEMLSTGNLNTKAFQELVLYYLRERITHKNLEIKHLVATNIYEWFVFDAAVFERLFARNKGLVRQFTDFEGGRMADNRTDFFYKEIAEPFIRSLTDEIPFTYFDLRTYEKPLRNADKADDNALIALFKILSPEHLLKLPFANDSNSLDKRFYSELLHIIGLTETKEGGKKLIGRNKPGERHSGTLLEETIIQLDNLDKLSRLDKPSQFGTHKEERLFNVALELSITWINRILFLKLLEAQLIAYHKGDPAFAFLQSAKIGSYDALNGLFFQVLAKRHDERNDDVQAAFRQVPYLNSSLFEPTEMEHNALFISNLRDDKSIPVFAQTVLKDEQGKRRTGTLNTLQYLFAFLDAYDFGAEGSEDIQEDNKTLINASVLGLIFEKINGYKDGSFFTPGFITMYMCRETIRRAVVQKFNGAKGWNCDTLEQLYDRIDDRNEANALVNSLKICDPAVGSGHFLVSALNELIAVKHDLRILQDRDGKRLKEYHLEVVNDELIITDDDGELFEYHPHNRESQRVQETLFHEKQTLIENCLFGVDINPNSVKICRLRLWIELLKNAYYKNPTELETLPNIDINIKCGNSLVSRFAIDADLKQALNKSKWNMDSYRIAVSTYRNASTKEQKREMERLIESIKSDFRSEIEKPLIQKISNARWKAEELSVEILNLKAFGQKINKKLLDDHAKAVLKLNGLERQRDEILGNKIYENAFEWRFEFPEVLNDAGEFVGFDVVIGNPPYIYNRDLSLEQRTYFQEKYKHADDLYVYFVYETNKLRRKNGFIALITPNTFFTLNSREKFREFLLDQQFQKYTFSGYCFDDAYVETVIIELGGINISKPKIIFVPNPSDYLKFESLETTSEIYKNNIYKRFFVPSQINLQIHSSINSKLIPISNEYSKLLSGQKSERSIIESIVSDLRPNDLVFLGLISIGEQGLVTGNNSKYIANIIDNNDQVRKINDKFLAELLKHWKPKLSINDLDSNPELYYEIAEEIKRDKNKPEIFGKFFIYKYTHKENVVSFNKLTTEEKNDGSESRVWVNYYKGNPEGKTWIVPYNECILWNRESVKELREGVSTNSRWQGSDFFDTTGFAWVDYFTSRIKAFFVDEGIYSKNIVKLHSLSELATDKFIVACLNSKFISYYIKNFITNTHTLQINDGRLVPIKIPNQAELKTIVSIVDQIIAQKMSNPEKETTSLEAEIDRLVYALYGLTEEEIAVVERA